MKKNFPKQLIQSSIVVLLLVAMTIPLSLGIKNRQVDAVAGIEDTVLDIPVEAQQILQTIKEWGLDSLASALLGYAGQKLTSVVVNKVTGTGSGDKPSQIISDFGKVLQSTAEKQSKILSDQLLDMGKDAASPYFSPYAQSFAESLVGTIGGTVEQYGEGSSAIPKGLSNFGLKDKLGDKWQSFETDASVGGWVGQLELADPGNTAVGFNIATTEELGRRIAKRDDEQKTKLSSNGILPSNGKCDTIFKANVDAGLASAVKDPGEFKFTPTNPGGFTTPTDQNGLTYEQANKKWQEASKEYKDAQKLNSSGAAIDITNKNATPCLVETIQNPIGTVQSLINSGLDLGSAKIAGGDELGEMIAGFITSFLKGAISAGLGAVQADLAQKPPKPVGGPEQVTSDPKAWNKTPSRVVDMKAELNVAVINTGRELFYLNKALQEYDAFPSAIYSLDQCLPGPKIGWRKRLDTLLKSSTKRLEKKANSNREKIATKAQDILDNVTVSMEVAQKETELVLLRPSLNIPGAPAMQDEIGKFKPTSDLRRELYRRLLERRSAEAQLTSIVDDIKASMSGLYPAGFKPIMTRVAWEEMSQAERDANFAIASEKTGQKIEEDSLETGLFPDDFIPVYYKTAADRPDDIESFDGAKNRSWDELNQSEKDATYQAAMINYLELRDPGGDGTSQCADGIDNNGNGSADNLDPGCTAPFGLDNNEAQATPPASDAARRDMVMAFTKSLTQYSIVQFYQWDRWNNGESILDVDNVLSFKKQKSIIRQRFARASESFGNAVMISNAKASLDQGETTNIRVRALADDCLTIKKLLYLPPETPNQSVGDNPIKSFDTFLGPLGVINNDAGSAYYTNDPNNLITSPQYLQYCPELAGKNMAEKIPTSASYVSGPLAKGCLYKLSQNPASGVKFKTAEVNNALKPDQGGSILERDCKTAPDSDCTAGSPDIASYVTTSTPEDGTDNAENGIEDETVVQVPAGSEINVTTESPYQQKTQFDIQNAFNHDYLGNLFCKFDDRMKQYKDELKPIIKVGKPMDCADDSDSDNNETTNHPTVSAAKKQWYDASRGEMLILYYPKNLDY